MKMIIDVRDEKEESKINNVVFSDFNDEYACSIRIDRDSDYISISTNPNGGNESGMILNSDLVNFRKAIDKAIQIVEQNKRK